MLEQYWGGFGIRDSPGSYPSVRFRIPRACIGFLLPPTRDSHSPRMRFTPDWTRIRPDPCIHRPFYTPIRPRTSSRKFSSKGICGRTSSSTLTPLRRIELFLEVRPPRWSRAPLGLLPCLALEEINCVLWPIAVTFCGVHNNDEIRCREIYYLLDLSYWLFNMSKLRMFMQIQIFIDRLKKRKLNRNLLHPPNIQTTE